MGWLATHHELYSFINIQSKLLLNYYLFYQFIGTGGHTKQANLISEGQIFKNFLPKAYPDLLARAKHAKYARHAHCDTMQS